MKRLCVIPARAGSKRVPHKNVKDFFGKPMIAHAIDAAKASGIYDVIHVSTDSDAIARVAEDRGIKPDFGRPEELTGDFVTIMDLLRYVVGEYLARGQEFDTICLIYATSPLVDPEDLKKACADFEAGDPDKALLAVAPFPAPIDHAFTINDQKDLLPFNADGLSRRTQDLSAGYYDAGMFCFYSPDYILKSSGAGDYTKFRAYVVPSWRATDINWPEDWEHAAMMFRAMLQKQSEDEA
ncbi:acylneuraminate cytidylyltransferase family protein [uncultured Roseibium sp.]|uniref:acylneuraminate cytidylyltransferase family protein n=1 Tax=uncultured Roseibium sp. TaxID=1936171 RepID=UPI003217AC9A